MIILPYHAFCFSNFVIISLATVIIVFSESDFRAKAKNNQQMSILLLAFFNLELF